MAKTLISSRNCEVSVYGKKLTIFEGQKIEFGVNFIIIDGIQFKSTVKKNLEIEDKILEKHEHIDKIYSRYDYLAKQYANRLWNDTDPAIQKKDLTQELRIRLYSTIQTYLLKWKNYRENGGVRPIPIEFYIKTAMVNKSRDLIKELSSIEHRISIESNGLQIGSNAVEISSVSKLNIFLGAQNLMELFTGKEKKIMQLYFATDFDSDKVLEFYKLPESKAFVEDLLNKGIDKLKDFLNNGAEEITEFCYYELQD